MSIQQISCKMNPYSKLYVDHEKDTETTDKNRKANKKLREIEKLKRKKNKTLEELKKIQEEEIWRAIAEPVEENPLMDTPELQLKRKMKQMERSREKEESRKMRQLREKQKEDIAKKNKIIHEKDKIIDEKDKFIDEMKTRFFILYEENARLRKQIEDMNNAKEVSLDEKLKNEFLECYELHKSYKKAYYMMMQKYHPDKKNGINRKMAEECSKILNNLKNEYVRD